MKDFLGIDMSVGDTVVYLTHSRTSSRLQKGIIASFSPKMVRVKHEKYGETSKQPEKCVVIK